MTADRQLHPFAVAVCRSCGRRAFPAPMLCAGCGGADFAGEHVVTARLERVTVVHRDLRGAIDPPTRVGRAVAGDEIAVIVRVDDDADVGDRVELGLDADAPVARKAGS